MYYIYPAKFYLEENGDYSVIFPDLNDLATCGDNLPHAFAMAQEACALYLFSSLKDGEKLPMPTPVNEVELDDNNCFVNLIFVNLDDFAKSYDDKPVKKTLTIPTWLNTACEQHNFNFSKILKDALINKLQEL